MENCGAHTVLLGYKRVEEGVKNTSNFGPGVVAARLEDVRRDALLVGCKARHFQRLWTTQTEQ